MISINKYKGDLFGGLTAGIVALPLALAFGIQAFGGINHPAAASMGAVAGLVGATLLGFFASLCGGTRCQVSGPTGPMTVISAALISGAWAASGGSFPAVIISMALAAIFCGLFQILFGLVRIGRYVRYIPYPVLSGFMSGIGVIIILQQLYPLFGLKSPVLVFDMIAQLITRIEDGVSLSALALGLLTILIIYLFPRLSKRLPATLVALVAVTLISLPLGLRPSLIIGDIPSALPTPFFIRADLGGLDWWAIIQAALVPGLTLAGLGSIDTLLTSVVADSITKTRHNSNRELIGQGIGNALAGLFAGIPGAGATMRTVVNVKSGGRSRLSGMVHALFLLAILLGLSSLVKYVPLSVLAGILITVGWGIIDFRAFRDLKSSPKSDAFVMLVVFFVTVFVDLLTAVGIGLVIACVLFMKKMSDQTDLESSMSTHDEESLWDDEKDMPQYIKDEVNIQRFIGPLFFGTVTGFNNMVNQIPDDTRVVIFRMKMIHFMDQSGALALENAIKELNAKNITVLLTIIQPQPQTLLHKMNIIPKTIPEDKTFPTFEACIDYLINEHNNKK